MSKYINVLLDCKQVGRPTKKIGLSINAGNEGSDKTNAHIKLLILVNFKSTVATYMHSDQVCG